MFAKCNTVCCYSYWVELIGNLIFFLQMMLTMANTLTSENRTVKSVSPFSPVSTLPNIYPPNYTVQYWISFSAFLSVVYILLYLCDIWIFCKFCCWSFVDKCYSIHSLFVASYCLAGFHTLSLIFTTDKFVAGKKSNLQNVTFCFLAIIGLTCCCMKNCSECIDHWSFAVLIVELLQF